MMMYTYCMMSINLVILYIWQCSVYYMLCQYLVTVCVFAFKTLISRPFCRHLMISAFYLNIMENYKLYATTACCESVACCFV